MNIDDKFNQIGIRMPCILLPNSYINLQKWSVIACDQHSSENEYWRKLKIMIGDSPSTLNMILPEVFLNEKNIESRISSINDTMKKYLEYGILKRIDPGFIYVERIFNDNKKRKGLLVEIDLERYDFRKGSNPLVRPSEETIPSRLPLRIKIREKAPLELPHTLVLIDDPKNKVIEPLRKDLIFMDKLYDFKMNDSNTRIIGYRFNHIIPTLNILNGLIRLSDDFKKRHIDKTTPLLYVVGDGNHSLAAAKSCWEAIKYSSKNQAVIMNHPARYSLVELVNIHDEGLTFEPIHRVLFNVNPADFFKYIMSKGVDYSKHQKNNINDALNELRKNQEYKYIEVINGADHGILRFKHENRLEIDALQPFLDEYIKKKPAAKLDYIHESDVVEELGRKKDNMGFFLPPIRKEDFFNMINEYGCLPKKSFSIGKPEEKRYYLESKLLI